jgi:hypothetical protein
MEQITIIQMLGAYKGHVGRCEYLSSQIALLRHDIARARECTAEDLSGPAPMNYGSMRSGGGVSLTERAGIMLADGYVSADAQEMERTIVRLQAECEAKQRDIACVNAWLHGLGAKDAWIIARFYFDGMTYAEIGHCCKAEFGSEYSKFVLRRMRKDALDKICEMAR